MNGIARTLPAATFVLAILSTAASVYNMAVIYLYQDEFFLRKAADDVTATAGMAALGGFGVILLFDGVSFLWLLTSLRRQPSAGRIVALVLGALCMFLFVVDKAMIDEIAREYGLGWATTGEWIILYGAMTIQLVYGLFVLGCLRLSCRRGQQREPSAPCLRDETVFVTAQIVGMVSGAVGLWLNYTFIRRQVCSESPLFLFPFYVLILMPYGFTVLYWIALRLGVRLTDWYDEKQWRNVAFAGLATLLLSIPGMALLLFVSQPVQALWFPHVLFLMVLLFSTSTLILYKYVA